MKDSPTPNLPLGEYQHYKGKRYRVIGVGRHTETDEYLVAYVPLYETEGSPDFWLRPYGMFVETVEVDGNTAPRFRRIAD